MGLKKTEHVMPGVEEGGEKKPHMQTAYQAQRSLGPGRDRGWRQQWERGGRMVEGEGRAGGGDEHGV